MTKGIPWMLVGSVVLLAFAFSHIHLSEIKLPQVNLPLANPQPAGEPGNESGATSPDAQQNAPAVTVVGPLADYLERQTASLTGKSQTRSRVTHPRDRIAPSPVGTSSPILQKTFTIRSTQDFSFEIPAHATNPQLHGTYRCFAKAAGTLSSDEDADVEFMVLNEPQYQALVVGRPWDAVFSADASHDQNVNFVLPASADSPVKYHLLFRNVAGGAARKVVQADFAVDF